MKKYRVIEPWEGVKEGGILEVDSGGYSSYQVIPPLKSEEITPHEIAILLKLGMIEDVEGKWRPKNKEQFYFVDSTGIVDYGYWYGGEADLYRLSIGNIHRTEADAIAYREMLIERAKSNE